MGKEKNPIGKLLGRDRSRSIDSTLCGMYFLSFSFAFSLDCIYIYYSLHVCLAGERVLCPHASRRRVSAPAQYVTEPMKTREIRTGLAVVRHINNERNAKSSARAALTPP